MKNKKILSHLCQILLLLTGCFTLTAAYSATFTPQLNIYGGVSRVMMNSSALYVSPSERDTLNGNNAGNSFTSGLGVSYGLNLTPNMASNRFLQYIHDVSLGADLLFSNSASTGYVYQFGIPSLNNYFYHLNFETTRLMFDGTAGFNAFHNVVMPFIKASIGAAAISTKYHESVNPNNQGGQLNLPTQYDYNFAYSLGAGLRGMLTKDLQLSLFYLYTNLGTVDTSTHSNTTGNPVTLQHPISTHLNSHSVLGEVSYQLG